MQGSINRECTQVICFSDLLIEMLWKPPELLSVTVDKKSKPGDVYAFGIILSEIITRTLPYENYGYPAKGTLFFCNNVGLFYLPICCCYCFSSLGNFDLQQFKSKLYFPDSIMWKSDMYVYEYRTKFEFLLVYKSLQLFNIYTNKCI